MLGGGKDKGWGEGLSEVKWRWCKGGENGGFLVWEGRGYGGFWFGSLTGVKQVGVG